MGRLDLFCFDIPLYNEVGQVHGGLGSSSVWSTYTGVHRGLVMVSMDRVVVMELE